MIFLFFHCILFLFCSSILSLSREEMEKTREQDESRRHQRQKSERERMNEQLRERERVVNESSYFDTLCWTVCATQSSARLHLSGGSSIIKLYLRILEEKLYLIEWAVSCIEWQLSGTIVTSQMIEWHKVAKWLSEGIMISRVKRR